jgi:AraC-like DNA-binding protein
VIDRHEYREHRPRAELLGCVDAFWTRDLDDAGDTSRRVVPDGCADVLIDLSEPGDVRAFVVGPMTRPIVVELEARSRVVAVRFRPGAARAFAGVPLSELVDARVELADLRRDADELEDSIAAARDAREALRPLERFLMRIVARGPATSAFVDAAIEQLARASNPHSVARLADELGCTRQHLTREFREHVGLGPKMLARVLRMQRATALLRERDSARLADVALDAGYCDQAHFSGEFRALCGVAPSQVRGAGSKSPRRVAAAALESRTP